jgi:hypothetical protein
MFVCCECCVFSGRGLCDELITRPEESYRLCCAVVCDLETSRIGAPYIYDISNLRVKIFTICIQAMRRRYMTQEIADTQHALGTQMGTRVTLKTRNTGR